MKNSSIALLILAPMLILAIGLSAYSASQTTLENSGESNSAVTDSMEQMSTMEIEAFNSQFTYYGGNQTGAKLKSLCGTLIANANTYSDDMEKIPEITAEISEGEEKTAKKTENSLEEYTNIVAEIRNSLDNKHAYSVEFNYTSDGVLNEIIIKY